MRILFQFIQETLRGGKNSSSQKKAKKRGGDENVKNAAGGALRGEKAVEARDVQFVDTKKVRAEFQSHAEKDRSLQEQRKNILTGSKLKYKHFSAHKRGEEKLQRICRELYEAVRQGYERAEALGFSSYFFKSVLPAKGCYEKTTDKIAYQNGNFLTSGSLFLREAVDIYQMSASAKRPIPLEEFQKFLAPFAQKFPYTEDDFQPLMAESILSASPHGRTQEIIEILNSLFIDWVSIGGDKMLQLDLFKAYLRANEEKTFSPQEMEQFDGYVDAFFSQNSNAERLLILKSTDWF